jgi:hypothetical protein
MWHFLTQCKQWREVGVREFELLKWKFASKDDGRFRGTFSPMSGTGQKIGNSFFHILQKKVAKRKYLSRKKCVDSFCRKNFLSIRMLIVDQESGSILQKEWRPRSRFKRIQRCQNVCSTGPTRAWFTFFRETLFLNSKVTFWKFFFFGALQK